MNNNFRINKVCTAAAARSRMSAGSLFPFMIREMALPTSLIAMSPSKKLNECEAIC